MGQNLASRLNSIIEDKITDDNSRVAIIGEMASSANISSGTVNQILNDEIDCPPLDRLSGFASALDVSQSSLVSAAENDGCEYSEEQARGLFDKFWQGIKDIFKNNAPEAERAISGERLHSALWSKIFELDEQIAGSDHYLVDMYFDESGIYALYADTGRLFRYQVVVQGDDIALGPRTQVMELHQPVATRTVIRQQTDGRIRWFSVSGTAVLNRSGAIDSRDLFDSCVQYAKETGKYPIRMFYHQGKISRDWQIDETAMAFKTGQADFLARDGYCYISSGLYDDSPLAKAEIQARQNNPDFWGDSIGFWPTSPDELIEISDGINIPIYREGFNVEISTLPETEASHFFTRTEVQRMTLQENREWDAFVALWEGDEEKARQWVKSHPEARNRAIEQAIDEAGMIARNDNDGNDDSDTSNELIIDDSVVEAISRLVIEGKDIATISKSVADIETTLVQRFEEIDRLTGSIEKLITRLETLEKRDAAASQQIADDTPAKFKEQGARIVYRPRMANAAVNEDGTPYNEKAKANMPKGVTY